jgi:hypothetical protein
MATLQTPPDKLFTGVKSCSKCLKKRTWITTPQIPQGCNSYLLNERYVDKGLCLQLYETPLPKKAMCGDSLQHHDFDG